MLRCYIGNDEGRPYFKTGKKKGEDGNMTFRKTHIAVCQIMAGLWLHIYRSAATCHLNSSGLSGQGQGTPKGVLWYLASVHWQQILWVLCGGGAPVLLHPTNARFGDQVNALGCDGSRIISEWCLWPGQCCWLVALPWVNLVCSNV